MFIILTTLQVEYMITVHPYARWTVAIILQLSLEIRDNV